ncbi:MAG: hypothetical protein K2W96_23405 [Gemmataceae bacterium]|nr:hypothetical protein [Gemmataceae bacterium]
MPIALTCDCGARFEIEDSYAGRDWPCPDCGAPVRAPVKANASPRPSLLALLAAGLALAGAFTLVGSVAAAILGLVAWLQVRASKGQVAGGRIALAALAGGVMLTVATFFVWRSPAMFPLGLWLRRQAFAGQLDASGPLDAVGADTSLKRPSKSWARAVRGRTTHPVLGDVQKGRDVLLVNLDEYAFADTARLAVEGNKAPGEMEVAIREELLPERASFFGSREDGGRNQQQAPSQFAVPKRSGIIEPVDGRLGYEWLYDVQRGGRRWRFLVRTYRKERGAASDPVFVVRAYCPAGSFERLEPELRQILDTLRLQR